MTTDWRKIKPPKRGCSTAIYRLTEGAWVRGVDGVMYRPGDTLSADKMAKNDLQYAIDDGTLIPLSGALPGRIRPLDNSERLNLRRVTAK